MYPILRTCPVCGEALLVTRLDCPQCATTGEALTRLRGEYTEVE